jgi:hypothetical protein
MGSLLSNDSKAKNDLCTTAIAEGVPGQFFDLNHMISYTS